MNISRKLSIAVLLSLISGFIYGQVIFNSNQLPGCGSDALLINLRKNAAFVETEKMLNESIRKKVIDKQLAATISQKKIPLKNIKTASNSKASISGTTVYTIPVVFHVINSNTSIITDAMINAALAGMNEAFAHLGIYGVDTLGVNTSIQFCMARTAPDGGITNGIDRINSYMEDNDMDMEGGIPPGLIYWDPTQYINIWVVNSIQAEIQPSIFSCGTWKRLGVGGYASAGWGVVVAGLGIPVLVHEMGHCLSLLHTFQGMNCMNGDCTVDGDMVCDTPPDRSINPSPCNDPENSCNTDTISGPFKKDMKDNISNFMDYGSPCPSVFTQGQTDRMRSFLEVFSGGSLLKSTKCTLPCTEAINANFDFNSNPHPITNDVVDFTNNTTGATNYKWYVNNALVDVTTNLKYQFTASGTYKVLLQASNSSSCFSSYTANVIVNCGVDARFSPDKRIMASKNAVYNDSVFFWNKSYGADSYKWYISDNTGSNEKVVSTDKDLKYMFDLPGFYKIRLESTKGSCTASSGTFNMTVYDPTADGQMVTYAVNCYKNDSLRVVFGINNLGYDTIPAGMTISFYDRPRTLPGAQKIGPDFITDKQILGRCGEVFTSIIKTNRFKPDSIDIVFNEDKKQVELSYFNNETFLTKFQQRTNIIPKDTTVFVNSNLPLKITTGATAIKSSQWYTTGSLSCMNCLSPILSVKDTTYLKNIVETIFGCTDTLYSKVNVFPIDIKINSSKVFCYHNDSLLVETTICLGNGYDKLKYQNEILYYDNDSLNASSVLLSKGVLDPQLSFSNACATVRHLMNMTNTGNIYSYVNPKMIQFEQTLSNNQTILSYAPYSIGLGSNVIDILRGEPLQLNIINQGEQATSIIWKPSKDLSCNNCPDPILKTNSSFDLRVIASTKYLCIDSADAHVNVYYQSHIALPNTFSPDGNGRNDIFYVIAGKEVTKVNQLQIYSRWGEKVFESSNVHPNDESVGWNGTYKGKPCALGTYVYYLVIQLQDGKTETYKGNISIIR